MSMHVPSRPNVTVATGTGNSGRAYSHDSSLANATVATASATSCTNAFATFLPWHSRRSSVTRPAPNSTYSWAITLANRGVELTTIRAF